jgi:hypothetical protein
MAEPAPLEQLGVGIYRSETFIISDEEAKAAAEILSAVDFDSWGLRIIDGSFSPADTITIDAQKPGASQMLAAVVESVDTWFRSTAVQEKLAAGGDHPDLSLELHSTFFIKLSGACATLPEGTHVDDGDITVNVCLGGTFGSGGLYILDTDGKSIPCGGVTLRSQLVQEMWIPHLRGGAIVHDAHLPHGALPLLPPAAAPGGAAAEEETDVECYRINLLLWYRCTGPVNGSFSSWSKLPDADKARALGYLTASDLVRVSSTATSMSELVNGTGACECDISQRLWRHCFERVFVWPLLKASEAAASGSPATFAKCLEGGFKSDPSAATSALLVPPLNNAASPSELTQPDDDAPLPPMTPTERLRLAMDRCGMIVQLNSTTLLSATPADVLLTAVDGHRWNDAERDAALVDDPDIQYMAEKEAASKVAGGQAPPSPNPGPLRPPRILRGGPGFGKSPNPGPLRPPRILRGRLGFGNSRRKPLPRGRPLTREERREKTMRAPCLLSRAALVAMWRRDADSVATLAANRAFGAIWVNEALQRLEEVLDAMVKAHQETTIDVGGGGAGTFKKKTSTPEHFPNRRLAKKGTGRALLSQLRRQDTGDGQFAVPWDEALVAAFDQVVESLSRVGAPSLLPPEPCASGKANEYLNNDLTLQGGSSRQVRSLWSLLQKTSCTNSIASVDDSRIREVTKFRRVEFIGTRPLMAALLSADEFDHIHANILPALSSTVTSATTDRRLPASVFADPHDDDDGRFQSASADVNTSRFGLLRNMIVDMLPALVGILEIGSKRHLTKDKIRLEATTDHLMELIARTAKHGNLTSSWKARYVTMLHFWSKSQVVAREEMRMKDRRAAEDKAFESFADKRTEEGVEFGDGLRAHTLPPAHMMMVKCMGPQPEFIRPRPKLTKEEKKTALAEADPAIFLAGMSRGELEGRSVDAASARARSVAAFCSRVAGDTVHRSRYFPLTLTPSGSGRVVTRLLKEDTVAQAVEIWTQQWPCRGEMPCACVLSQYDALRARKLGVILYQQQRGKHASGAEAGAAEATAYMAGQLAAAEERVAAKKGGGGCVAS